MLNQNGYFMMNLNSLRSPPLL